MRPGLPVLVPALSVSLALLVVAVPAVAFEAQCRFSKECVEDAPCTGTDYALEIGSGGDGSSVRLSDIAGEVSATLATTAIGGTVIIARDAAAIRLLTLVPGGAARYTLHLAEGPMVVSYLGSCETR